jgi:hypothetical protein
VAEYRLSFDAAVWDFPLLLAVVMLPVRNERQGGKSGPSYATNAAIDARNQARIWLETHFRIVQKPLAETGWVLCPESET